MIFFPLSPFFSDIPVREWTSGRCSLRQWHSSVWGAAVGSVGRQVETKGGSYIWQNVSHVMWVVSDWNPEKFSKEPSGTWKAFNFHLGARSLVSCSVDPSWKRCRRIFISFPIKCFPCPSNGVCWYLLVNHIPLLLWLSHPMSIQSTCGMSYL